MGQYYKAIAIDKKQSVSSWTFNSGSKLMEHSWRPNPFVGAIAQLISKGGAWYGSRIIWGGDYADPELDENGNPKQVIVDGKSYDANLYDLLGDEKHQIKPNADKKKWMKLRYLKNLDTNEYIALGNVPDKDGWVIHPLPLMTCDGNGRGGGDYHGDSPLVGKWARNRVVMQQRKPRNCKEIKFDLVE